MLPQASGCEQPSSGWAAEIAVPSPPAAQGLLAPASREGRAWARHSQRKSTESITLRQLSRGGGRSGVPGEPPTVPPPSAQPCAVPPAWGSLALTLPSVPSLLCRIPD